MPEYLTPAQFQANNHARNMRSLDAALRELIDTVRSVKAIYAGVGGDAYALPPTQEQSVEMLRIAQAVALNAGDIAKLCRPKNRLEAAEKALEAADAIRAVVPWVIAESERGLFNAFDAARAAHKATVEP